MFVSQHRNKSIGIGIGHESIEYQAHREDNKEMHRISSTEHIHREDSQENYVPDEDSNIRVVFSSII